MRLSLSKCSVEEVFSSLELCSYQKYKNKLNIIEIYNFFYVSLRNKSSIIKYIIDMEFQELLSKRRSVRKFSPQAVEREVLERLIEMTLSAPSSRNSHSTSFMVVTNRSILERISTMRDYGSSFVKNAPAAILILGDNTKSDLTTVNASISATVLQLAAVELGLSSCWVHVDGRPQKKDEPTGAEAIELVRELLPIPAECDVLCLVALGYSDFVPAPLPEFDHSALVSYID